MVRDGRSGWGLALMTHPVGGFGGVAVPGRGGGGVGVGGGGGVGGFGFGLGASTNVPLTGFFVSGTTMPGMAGLYGPKLTEDEVKAELPWLAADAIWVCRHNHSG